MVKAAVTFAVISGLMVVDTYATHGFYTAKALHAFKVHFADFLLHLDAFRRSWGV